MTEKRRVATAKCSDCGNTALVEDESTGELVCSSCGLVLKEGEISSKPEWRAYTFEETQEKSRVGPPNTLTVHDRGLSTTIDIGKDGVGKWLKGKKAQDAWRLKRWHDRTRIRYIQGDRNLSSALTIINRLSDKLAIPRFVREQAAYSYRQILHKHLARGRTIHGLAVASLYAACRQSNTPRMLREFAVASGTQRKEIGRLYRFIVKNLDLKMPAADAISYIGKIASKANVSMVAQNRAKSIIQRLGGKLSGGSPLCIAAGALYVAVLAENEKVTQKELAEASGVTEVSVRNQYHRITELCEKNEVKTNGGTAP